MFLTIAHPKNLSDILAKFDVFLRVVNSVQHPFEIGRITLFDNMKTYVNSVLRDVNADNVDTMADMSNIQLFPDGSCLIVQTPVRIFVFQLNNYPLRYKSKSMWIFENSEPIDMAGVFTAQVNVTYEGVENKIHCKELDTFLNSDPVVHVKSNKVKFILLESKAPSTLLPRRKNKKVAISSHIPKSLFASVVRFIKKARQPLREV